MPSLARLRRLWQPPSLDGPAAEHNPVSLGLRAKLTLAPAHGQSFGPHKRCFRELH